MSALGFPFPPMNPGDGCRLLDDGEAVETSDEVFSYVRGAWEPACAGDAPSRVTPMRRRVVVVDGDVTP